jgi:hypothetical protein
MSNLIPWVIALYLAFGGVWAAKLLRQGQSWSTAAASVLLWPLLLGVDGAADGGPNTGRILAAFAALESTLADPAARGVVEPAELEALRRSLLSVDARLGMVERLLGDPAVARAGEATVQPLKVARESTLAELDAALGELVQLRVQLGLVALAGDSAPVRGRLSALTARVRALDELSRIGGSSGV